MEHGQLVVLHDDADAADVLKPIADQLKITFQQVTSPSHLREFAASHRGVWGCVVLDVQASGQDAFEVLDWLAQEHPCLGAIIWSRFLDVTTAVTAMRQGALDVIAKDHSSAALLVSLNRALAISRQRHQQWRDEQRLRTRLRQLTPAETSVLNMILEGRTNKEIAASLDVGLRTVEARRQRILQVMESPNAVRLALTLARLDIANTHSAN
jgi:FixJ family two-component response regulator